MKYLILSSLLMLAAGNALAGVTHQPVTAEFVRSGIPIVDIRTEEEWRQTGLVEGAIPLTFFDAAGNYDAAAFLQQLEQKVDKSQPIALICRTGNRTRIVSEFLGEQGYQVINLQGGLMQLLQDGYQPQPYQP